MRIIPTPQFRHAGNLRYPPNLPDPRENEFAESEIEVDLRKCEFINPPAVLWCIIYPLLVRYKGIKCSLLVPENTGVCVHLKSLGLFNILRENGVEVDDRGIRDVSEAQIVLPLTKFISVSQVDDLANSALESLTQTGLGAPNLHPLVSEIFAELAMNAAQHSKSTIGAYGLIQFYESGSGPRFVCSIADGGIGIRKTLEMNPELQPRVPYDWIAVELAIRERISGTGDQTRGIGLYGVAEDMRKAGRSLIIHSGIGSLEIREDMQSQARRTRLFPGTLAYASIPA